MIEEKVLKRKYFKFLIKGSSHGMEIYLQMFPIYNFMCWKPISCLWIRRTCPTLLINLRWVSVLFWRFPRALLNKLVCPNVRSNYCKCVYCCLSSLILQISNTCRLTYIAIKLNCYYIAITGGSDLPCYILKLLLHCYNRRIWSSLLYNKILITLL